MNSLAITRVLDSAQKALGSLRPGQRFMIGVSGGRDSVVLLDVLLRLEYRNLVVVHVNHGLRARASGGDAAFVRRLAARSNLSVMIARAATLEYAKIRGVSVELSARELRHAAFAAAASRFHCPRLLLAHHAEDQVETCLFNYLRGTGAPGLAGMRSEGELKIGPRSLRVFRPLLSVRRAEIDAYVDAAGLRFREDASNSDPKHTRNRLRHRVIPALTEAMGPAVPDAILRTAEILGAEDDFLRVLSAERLPLTADLPVSVLRGLHPAIQRRVLHSWLKEFGPPECGFAEVEQVRSLLPLGAKVAKINLPEGCHVRRTAGKIFIEIPSL